MNYFIRLCLSGGIAGVSIAVVIGMNRDEAQLVAGPSMILTALILAGDLRRAKAALKKLRGEFSPPRGKESS